MFNNELDVLGLRLSMLNDCVDKFVIVEASRTQTGAIKEYHFENNKDKFAAYATKIIHIKVDDLPLQERHNVSRGGLWENENYQRNCIMRALTFCKPDDLIIISDVDEIPRPDIIREIYSNHEVFFFHKDISISRFFHALFFHIVSSHRRLISIKKNCSPWEFLDKTPISLTGDMFYFYFNWRVTGKRSQWSGPVLCKYKIMQMPQQLRNNKDLYPYIPNSAFHFTYMGGTDAIISKINNMADYAGDVQLVALDVIEKMKHGLSIIDNKSLESVHDDFYKNDIISIFLKEHSYLIGPEINH